MVHHTTYNNKNNKIADSHSIYRIEQVVGNKLIVMCIANDIWPRKEIHGEAIYVRCALNGYWPR